MNSNPINFNKLRGATSILVTKWTWIVLPRLHERGRIEATEFEFRNFGDHLDLLPWTIILTTKKCTFDAMYTNGTIS